MVNPNKLHANILSDLQPLTKKFCSEWIIGRKTPRWGRASQTLGRLV